MKIYPFFALSPKQINKLSRGNQVITYVGSGHLDGWDDDEAAIAACNGMDAVLCKFEVLPNADTYYLRVLLTPRDE